MRHNNIAIRYLFSEEDKDYLRKHGGKYYEGNDVQLRFGPAKRLSHNATNVFSDCHFYEGIENLIIDQLGESNEVVITGINPQKIDYEEDGIEFNIKVKGDTLTYSPDGSRPYHHRMSKLTSETDSVVELKGKYFKIEVLESVWIGVYT